jgi:hypothetical protein
MLIEITETHPPQFGKKMAHVVAAGGEKFELYPEVLAGLKIGGRYEIDIGERDYQGRKIKKITKAAPVASAPTTNHSGHTRSDGEAEFVDRTLAALILKGEVRYSKQQLLDATDMLPALWGVTFGGKPRNGGAQ